MKTPKHKDAFLYFSICLLVVFVFKNACKKQKAEWSGAIEKNDGITVVKNTIEPLYKEDIANITEELTIGTMEKRKVLYGRRKRGWIPMCQTL
ncbi:MAG: hypothetical protein JXB26_00755 [Candidatus Aminicenantes bacterium]|nr:hypothetical protein [Candidatus Aminicenantes bacterium]